MQSHHSNSNLTQTEQLFQDFKVNASQTLINVLRNYVDETNGPLFKNFSPTRAYNYFKSSMANLLNDDTTNQLILPAAGDELKYVKEQTSRQLVMN